MFRRLALVTCCVAVAVAGLAPVSEAADGGRADFTVQPSVEQVAVTGASAGATAVLRAADGRKVASRPIDAAGSVLFRAVGPGAGYVVSVGSARAAPVTVTSPTDTPPASLYTGQHLGPGYGYLTTRDGTKLSINITLPGPAGEGPYPTVVEYSGYDPSNPGATQPASRIAQLLGFATVGVNLRGTGCSGGAYDYFEELQSLDGYDVVETIAAQPWVAHGTVGMVGISFPGITQLFVAATRPPHLAAITPLSVLDDTYATLYPGGIFNDGFALGWAKDRQADARPSTSSGAARGGRASASRPATRPAAPTRRSGCRPPACSARSGPTPTAAARPPTRSRRRRSSTTSTCRCSSPAPGRTRRPAATSRTCSATSRRTSR